VIFLGNKALRVKKESDMPLTFANKLTVARIFCVPVFISTVLYYSPDKDYLRFIALGVFLAAVLLDALDGYVARRFHQETAAGAVLDPLADKVLSISAFICLYKVGVLFTTVRLPIWLVVTVISREVVLLLGAMVIRWVNGRMTVRPTVWGKMTMLVEALVVVGILLQWPLFSYLWNVVFVLVLISGTDYLLKGLKELNTGGAG
jgi:CDP-diacylglycerol--glycerol-3-phosphate 3-phosphatidyltransferase